MVGVALSLGAERDREGGRARCLYRLGNGDCLTLVPVLARFVSIGGPAALAGTIHRADLSINARLPTGPRCASLSGLTTERMPAI
jgi:hypothetical protein